MIIGDPKLFAIDVTVDNSASDERWLFGMFVFVIGDEQVGNPDDLADLKGCLWWLNQLLTAPVTEADAWMATAPVATLFEWVRGSDDNHGVVQQESAAQERWRRFDISHIGMSSFDRYEVLLFEFHDRSSRIAWRQTGYAPHAYNIGPDVFRTVVSECVAWLHARADSIQK